jgi:hypothetical protein
MKRNPALRDEYVEHTMKAQQTYGLGLIIRPER